MRRLLLIFVLFLFSFSCAQAADFTSFYKVTYRFSPNGQSTVEQEISLVNATADLYASEYSLSIKGDRPEKISAFDRLGPVSTNLITKDDTFIISAKLNEKTVGKGKVASFILKYSLAQTAIKKGNVWAITIPRLDNAVEISDYQLHLIIPKSYGKISQINPTIYQLDQTSTDNHFIFTKDQIITTGVFATFGQFQVYRLNLLYPLVNEYDYPIRTSIALPPDTSRQMVQINSISPEPQQATIDADGNWLFDYQIEANQNIEVQADLQIKVVLNNPDYPAIIPENDHYLAATQFWPNDATISSISAHLTNPKQIFDYVVKYLQYDYSRIGANTNRRGALFALHNPTQSLCTEYTDLFVALSRSIGIPAREHEGLGFTDDPKLISTDSSHDILHSWPEYYDASANQWQQVDPTWADTSGGFNYFSNFDTGHLTFVIHGLSDNLPYPAGSYSKNNQGRLIDARLQDQDLLSPDSRWETVSVETPSFYTLLTNKSTLILRNISGHAIYTPDIRPVGDIKVLYEANQIVPPYGNLAISITNTPPEDFSDHLVKTAILIDNVSVMYQYYVRSLALRLVIPIFSLSVLLITGLIIKLRKNNHNA